MVVNKIGGSIVLIGAGCYFIYKGFKQLHKFQLISDIPRSKIRSIAMGLVEVHGNIEAKDTIITPFSKSKCVFYKYIVKEYKVYRINDKTIYKWDVVSNGQESVGFWAKDETGKIYVDPKKAEFNINVKNVYLQKVGLRSVGVILNALKKNIDPNNIGDLKLIKGVDFNWGYNVGDRKYYEYYLEPNENLFVIGTAARDSNVPGKVLIKKGVNNPNFIISNKGENELLKHMKRSLIFYFLIGIVSFILGIVLLLSQLGLI